MPATPARGPDEASNRRLRRVDWRFLLPDPRPTQAVCFADEVLREGVSSISERLADPRHVPPGGCDLAVAVNPTPATLQAAWAALRPGGACYTEWTSPLAGGPAKLRRRLEAAGLTSVACYWCWPVPGRAPPYYWVPLEAPGARACFLASRSEGRAAVHRLARGVQRAAWLTATRAGLLVPVCAIAQKPSQAASKPTHAWGMNTDLAETITAQWESWGLGAPPDRLSWLLLTGGTRSTNKVVGLVCAEPDPSPRLAVKLSRVPRSAPDLEREAATLRAVVAQRPQLAPSVPRILFCREHAGGLALGETALTGRPLYTQLRRENYRELALKATAWLAELAGRPEPQPRERWWHRLVEPALAECDEGIGAGVASGFLRETRERLATLDALPLVCSHLDFAPFNVLLGPGGELAVVDWENGEVQGLPAVDLIHFLTFLTFHLDDAWRRGQLCESYRASLDRSTLPGRVRAECLAGYADQVGLDRAALRPLAIMVWLLRAQREYRVLVADAGGRPQPGALQRSLYVRLWEEELRQSSAAVPA